MKSLLKIALIFAIVVLANSCRKESLIPEIPNPEPIDHAKDFLKVERIDTPSDYFITGKFDGKAITFATTPYADYDDSSDWNALFLNEGINLDQINLVRENKDRSIHLAIIISQANLLKRQLPFQIPTKNQPGSEIVDVQLINLNRMQEVEEQGSNERDFMFDGSNVNQSLQIQVTRFIDNTLEGTFEGTLSTESGSTIAVKNGRFRIKINRIIYGN
ncbi:MAG TPA: hypothetical protein DCL77_07630 [Prolixibacteraceae bacterium]|jgi:hypothetical protein|nr:hypothetical protein [Prolixibacteraceae bacterium]